jgi:putative Ig domain-containing protein
MVRHHPDAAIEGVPTRRGRFDFVVQVADGEGDVDTKPFSIVVIDPLVITTSSIAPGTISRPYTETLGASGGIPPYVWAIEPDLPASLSLDATTGAIAGRPHTSGAFSITVRLTDSANHTATRTMNLVIR